jgi:hypothetical protein
LLSYIHVFIVVPLRNFKEFVIGLKVFWVLRRAWIGDTWRRGIKGLRDLVPFACTITISLKNLGE